MRHRALLVTVWLLIASGMMAADTKAASPYQDRYDGLVKSRKSDAERLRELFNIRWEYQMHEYPEWATYVGYPGQNDRWTDNSAEAIERRKKELQAPLKVLETIKRDKLDAADQLNYDLFRRGLEQDIEATRFKSEYLAITQLGGVQQDVPQVLELTPHTSLKDYEDILARLNGVSNLVAQDLEQLQKGLDGGITAPRITLRDVPQQVEDLLVSDSTRSPLLLAFSEFPESISAADREKLKNRAIVALTNSVLPAFRELHTYLTNKYVPGARESIACGDLPDGKAWYEFNVRKETTTGMTPQEIHELGLSEVKRIRKEMDAVIAQTGFKGSFEDFAKYLRTDPKFYYTDAQSLLTGYRDIAKRADPQLIRLFGKLPRLPYGVKPVPSYMEKSQTTAYYEQGSVQAGRPGYFFANTYDLKTRPKWEMEPLSLHESVPGHHLQISLAQELEDMPEFRKQEGYTAFVEGWGLYSESLGEEMGFYKDPYSKYGRLTYEIWRAIRLVVDTGMHSMGWSRQQAIDYFKANTGKQEHDIIVEVDRYIVWPGQACAYKIGELRIKELRAYATKELGDKFDVRAFHDQVLGNGALPLDVLDKRIKDWVAERKAKASDK